MATMKIFDDVCEKASMNLNNLAQRCLMYHENNETALDVVVSRLFIQNAMTWRAFQRMLTP